MDLSQTTFLIVDDHAFARRAIASVVTGLGASTPHEAADGSEGLEKIRKKADEGHPYDIVFLDWAMPEMNGFDVLLTCRKDERLKDMMIVMVSSESEDANILKAIEEGATAYIPKPFQPELLIHKINDIIGWKNGLPELDGDG
ncbi:MAG: response regulator [Alphaproteobacteria bacterium]|nr:response regulator [Alphaproteobacteria bacterium]